MTTKALRGSVFALALTCALLSASCQKSHKVQLGDPNDSPPASSGESSAPPPRVITAGSLTFTLPPFDGAQSEAVFTGYQAFWVALAKALANPRGANPDFYATTTGGARSYFANALAVMKVAGRTQSGPAHLNPTIASVVGSIATVSDCADLSRLRVLNHSRQPVNKLDSRTTQIQAQLIMQNGQWVVQDYAEGQRACKTAPVSG